jgi:ABC-type dipeptide/oligopeptide/nickel transport system ATPase component
MDPEILVADETGLGARCLGAGAVLELIDDVRKRFNLAVLFITHDLRVAAQVCDRIAVMHRARWSRKARQPRCSPRRSTTTPVRCSTRRRGRISSSEVRELINDPHGEERSEAARLDPWPQASLRPSFETRPCRPLLRMRS